MSSPLVDKDFIRLLDDRLEKVFTVGGEELPDIKSKFFKVVNSKKAWLEYFSMGGVPDPAEFHGAVTYQDVSPGYWTKIEPKEYAGGIQITRRLIDTDRYDVIENMAKQLGGAMKRKMNKIAHEPFTYHDSTAFNFMTNEEGVALCSNSHTTKSGASTSTGFDNYSTLPFSAVNLEAVRVMSLGLRDDIGERFSTNFDTIVHPSNLSEKVWEVTHSTGKVDEMTNNANYQKGRWKSIELPLLDDTDSSDWYIIDSSACKRSLIWDDSIKLEFHSDTDFDSMIRKYISYLVAGWGWIDWRWIIGCAVS